MELAEVKPTHDSNLFYMVLPPLALEVKVSAPYSVIHMERM